MGHKNHFKSKQPQLETRIPNSSSYRFTQPRVVSPLRGCSVYIDADKDQLPSKIDFVTPTPDKFTGDKLQFLLDDEAGMEFPSTYWPAMARCPACCRFIKKGLKFFLEHHFEDCPSVNKIPFQT